MGEEGVGVWVCGCVGVCVLIASRWTSWFVFMVVCLHFPPFDFSCFFFFLKNFVLVIFSSIFHDLNVHVFSFAIFLSHFFVIFILCHFHVS